MALKSIGDGSKSPKPNTLDGSRGSSKDVTAALGLDKKPGKVSKQKPKGLDLNIAELVNAGKRFHQSLGGLGNKVDFTA